MFAKPFSLILVYILTICNTMILISPIIAAAAPFIAVKGYTISLDYYIYAHMKFVFFFAAFLVSFLMVVYLFFDFLFGFSVRSSLKNCTRYEKVKDYDFLTDLFNQVKSKFGEKNVKLYIKNSDEINAYAISSLGNRAVVLTRGIIDHYLRLLQRFQSIPLRPAQHYWPRNVAFGEQGFPADFPNHCESEDYELRLQRLLRALLSSGERFQMDSLFWQSNRAHNVADLHPAQPRHYCFQPLRCLHDLRISSPFRNAFH